MEVLKKATQKDSKAKKEKPEDLAGELEHESLILAQDERWRRA